MLGVHVRTQNSTAREKIVFFFFAYAIEADSRKDQKITWPESERPKTHRFYNTKKLHKAIHSSAAGSTPRLHIQ
jgi:hypothetical protein